MDAYLPELLRRIRYGAMRWVGSKAIVGRRIFVTDKPVELHGELSGKLAQLVKRRGLLSWHES